MGRGCLDGHFRPTTDLVGRSSYIVTIKTACWLQLADSARRFNNVVREVTVVLRSVKD